MLIQAGIVDTANFKGMEEIEKLLYNHVTFTVQKRLLREGIPFIIVPVKIT